MYQTVTCVSDWCRSCGKQRWVGIAVWLVPTIGVFLALFTISRSVSDDEIRRLVQRTGVGGPIVLTGLLLLTYVLAPLSSSPLVFAGFYLYGPQVVICTAVASWISCITNFLLSRMFGRSLVVRLVGTPRMDQVDKLTSDYGLPALLLIRVFESEFHKIVSYAFGLTSVKFGPYVVVSSLGMLPGAAIWYWVSSRMANPFVFVLTTQALGLTLSGVFVLGTLLVRNLRSRHCCRDSNRRTS